MLVSPKSIREKSRLMYLALLTIGVILGGCGSSKSAEPTATPIPATATATPIPPTPTPDTAVSRTVHVEDMDGYTFDVTYRYDPRRPERSLANDKPGYSSLIDRFGLTISITNTTPGRNLVFKNYDGITSPQDQPQLLLVASWKGNDPICQAEYLDKTESFTGTRIMRNFYGGAPEIDRGCSVVLGFGRIPIGLGPNETYELTVYSGNDRGFVAGLAGIPDASYDDVAQSYAEPANIAIFYQGPDSRRFVPDCKNYGMQVPLEPSFFTCWMPYPLPLP